MNIRGYNLTTDWKMSSIGHVATATRDGKKYFMKKYGECKKPIKTESMKPNLYNHLENTFNKFKDYRIRINESLKSLAGPGGNIVLPSDWFVHEVNYIEATEFIENVVSETEVYRLSDENIKFIMLTALAALYNIHRKNIVHSDLKLPNVLVAKNSSGNIVAKLIDFDRSYFADDINPDYLGGDQNYMSPELNLAYMRDWSDESLSFLSPKSDVFSMGLIFYNYLTKGEFPGMANLNDILLNATRSGRKIYPSEVLLNGAKLVISKKIKDLYLKRLLAAMLEFDPSKRISSHEAFQALRNKTILPRIENSCIIIEGEEEITSFTVEFKESSLGNTTVAKGKKLPKPTDPTKEGYTFGGWFTDASCTKPYDFNSLVNSNLILYAKWNKKEDVPSFEMWPEDKFYEFDVEALKEAKYVDAVKCVVGVNKVYKLTSVTGRVKYYNINTLKLAKFVKRK